MITLLFASSFMEQNDPIFRALTSALELLAKPADYQKKHLDKFHEAADILRSTPDEDQLSQTLKSARLISSVVVKQIEKIDDIFCAFIDGKHGNPWTANALATLPEWEEVRVLSRRALMALHRPGS